MYKPSKKKPPNQSTQHNINPTTNSENPLFFERQSKLNLNCGLYAVNNLLGEHKFNVQDFDQICSELKELEELAGIESQSCCIKRHNHWCGGDYDANVLFKALDNIGYEIQWIDKRKQDNTQQIKEKLENTKSIGCLMNIKKSNSFLDKLLGKIFCTSSRHWCGIRKIEKKYILLDSMFDEPLIFSSVVQTINYLLLQLKQNGEIILVKEKNVPK